MGVSQHGWQDALGTTPVASVLNPGGSSFLHLSWRAVERRCLPLGCPASFPGPDWCVLGQGGMGRRWTHLDTLPPLQSPLRTGRGCSPWPPITLSCTHYLLPHEGPCLLTFSMTPTTLQPLSCSRAELSVRMGRSLRLLKPCRGETGSGPSPPQPLLLARQWAGPPEGSGQEWGTFQPHSPHIAEQESWS